MEYVVWGVRPNGTNEELLLTKLDNKNIQDRYIAEWAIKELVKKGCSSCRIQTIDLTDNKINFSNH